MFLIYAYKLMLKGWHKNPITEQVFSHANNNLFVYIYSYLSN